MCITVHGVAVTWRGCDRGQREHVGEAIGGSDLRRACFTLAILFPPGAGTCPPTQVPPWCAAFAGAAAPELREGDVCGVLRAARALAAVGGGATGRACRGTRRTGTRQRRFAACHARVTAHTCHRARDAACARGGAGDAAREVSTCFSPLHADAGDGGGRRRQGAAVAADSTSTPSPCGKLGQTRACAAQQHCHVSLAVSCVRVVGGVRVDAGEAGGEGAGYAWGSASSM